MLLEERLSGRIHKADIDEFVVELTADDDGTLFDTMYCLIFNSNRRVSENAAWILSHCQAKQMLAFVEHQEKLIDESMNTHSMTKRRLLMTILLKLPCEKEAVRTDFLDFCLHGITDTSQPVSVRALCVYHAFKQCQFFPELMDELEMVLQMLDGETLTPGLRCARMYVMKHIQKKDNNGLSNNN